MENQRKTKHNMNAMLHTRNHNNTKSTWYAMRNNNKMLHNNTNTKNNITSWILNRLNAAATNTVLIYTALRQP